MARHEPTRPLSPTRHHHPHLAWGCGMGPVTIAATVHRSDARKFDLDGVTPTIKACIDGLRDAGLLDEDHWGVITELTIRRGEQWADAALVLTITEQEAVA